MSRAEQAAESELTQRMEALVDELHQRNLANAVALAMEAARGQGPLVEHFAELGRRFGNRTAHKPADTLRAIKGGRA